MNRVIQFVLPALAKLLGLHLNRRWLATSMTVATAVLAVLAALGVIDQDKADLIYGYAAAVFAHNVVVTSRTKPRAAAPLL